MWRIALFQQVVEGRQRVLHRRRVRIFRRQTVRRAEHAHAALAGQRRGEALGVVQTAAGIAAAVEIQHHAAAPLVLGHDPRALKALEIMVADQYLPLVEGTHQLAQLVLPLAGHLQRAARHEGLEEIQL